MPPQAGPPLPGQGARRWGASRESPILTGATGQVLPAWTSVRCVFMVKTALVAGLAAVVFAACGYSPCACDGPGTLPVAESPSTGPDVGFDAVVTENDRAVTIRSGQKLEVVLRAKPGMS